EQTRFHCGTMFSEDLFELRESNVERVRTQRALLQKFIDIGNQSDLTEFPLIIESEPVMLLEFEQHSCVMRRCFPIFEIIQRTGHAEVQPQPQVSVSADKQMFAVAATRFEVASFQSGRQLTRRNALQNMRASHIDTGDPLAQRSRVKVSLENFYVGQLWHRFLR